MIYFIHKIFYIACYDAGNVPLCGALIIVYLTQKSLLFESTVQMKLTNQ